MFYIDKKGGIHISRGDSAKILTCVEKITENGVSEEITVGYNACVIFTVKSKYSGELLIKHILTEDDYADNMLVLNISAAETDFEPDGCEYSFMYVPDMTAADQAYTYAQGDFEIMHSVSRLCDLGDDENGNN